MVQALVQSHSRYLLLRGSTYYFRFVLPKHVRELCPSLPREVKRSLATDSFASALYLISEKLSFIGLIKRSRDAAQLTALYRRLEDFSGAFGRFVDRHMPRNGQAAGGVEGARKAASPRGTPRLSEAWKGFVQWKGWSAKSLKTNQLLFANIKHFLGDVPVGSVSKRSLEAMLAAVAALPQRNKRQYRRVPLAQLAAMQVPEEDRVSSKTVKEHLKLCQGFFSSYLVKEVEVLDQSPTERVSLAHADRRFASLADAQVLQILERSRGKPEWFHWMLMLSAYSGARRSELARLRPADFKVCPDTGRYYFVVHKGKTSAARRQVPIHQHLVDAGLIDWVHQREGLVFPVAHANPNRVSDMFASLLDVRVNDLGERIVFHSMRHTFITKARSSGVETTLVQQVVGHEKTGAGVTDRYTHTFPLRSVLVAVDCVEYGS